MTVFKLLIGILLSLWLTSCATQKPVSATSIDSSAKILSPQDKTLALLNLQQWQINALIGIKSETDSGSINMKWRQKNKSFSILLYGPLGANSVTLRGVPGKVLMETANGKKITAESPETLLAEQTGWKLPVSHLLYWIRGLEVPSLPSQKKLDSASRLTELDQSGWHIQYLQYSSIRGLELPVKIFLNNPSLKIKIIIHQWEI